LETYLDKSFGPEYGDLCGYNDKFNMQLINTTRYYEAIERRVNNEGIKKGISLD
jgi:hypothetical protein